MNDRDYILSQLDAALDATAHLATLRGALTGAKGAMLRQAPRTVFLLHTWTRHDPSGVSVHATREGAQAAAAAFVWSCCSGNSFDDEQATIREALNDLESGHSWVYGCGDEGCRIEEAEVQS